MKKLIVKNSDIAQLVLGYLRDNNLEHAANIFCKTNPFLAEEYHLLKKGLRSVNIGGSNTLCDIIKEHCEIKSKVFEMINILPAEDKARIMRQNTLVDKISFLFKMIQKEKGFIKTETQKRRMKRQRSVDSETTHFQELSSNYSKRRRVSASYFFLGSNSTMIHDSSFIEDSVTEYDDNISSEEYSNGNSSSQVNVEDTNANKEQDVAQTSKDSEHSLNNADALTVSIPILSETILKKTEFQNFLVENINKTLTSNTSSQNVSTQSTKNESNNSNNNSTNQNDKEEDEDVLRNQIDELIKQILDATEKNPIFDEIIEEAIDLANSAKKSNKSDTKRSPCLNKNILLQSKTVTKPVSENESKMSSIPLVSEQNIISSSSTIPEKENTSEQGTIFLENNNSMVPSSSQKIIVLNSDETAQGSVGNDGIISCTNNFQILNGNDQIVIDFGNGPVSIPLSSFPIPLLVNDSMLGNFQQSQIQQQQTQQGVINQIISDTQCDSELIQSVSQSNNIEQMPSSSNQTTMPFEILSEVTATATKQIINPNTMKITSNPLDGQPIDREDQTPLENMIKIPVERSLSSPRRRTSHIRTLNFNTPIKAKLSQDQLPCDTTIQQSENIPIIGENVLVLASEAGGPSISILNEATSNSNSFDLYAENSNITVIRKESISSDTPKRKTKNKRSCVRQISRSNSEEEERPLIDIIKRKHDKSNEKSKTKSKNKSNKKKILINKEQVPQTSKAVKTKDTNIEKSDKKNNEIDIGAEGIRVEGVDPLEEWKNMRAAFCNPNWDQHLRILESKSVEESKQLTTKELKKKKKITEHKVKNKKKPSSKKTNQKNEQKENIVERIVSNSPSPKMMTRKSTENLSKASEEKLTPSKVYHTSQTSSSKKSSFMKFKIPTPSKKNKKVQETNKNENSEEISQKDENQSNLELEKSQQEVNVQENTAVLPATMMTTSSAAATIVSAAAATTTPAAIATTTSAATSTELESTTIIKRTHQQVHNIALLLETPSKVDATQIPVTPRFIEATEIETPISKLLKSIEFQTTYQNLYDIPTPNFAITPGAGLIPNTEKETPPLSGAYSNRLTDYSSGGSYYKPDESEDLDKHINRLLKSERKKKTEKSTNQKTTSDIIQEKGVTSLNDSQESSISQNKTIETSGERSHDEEINATKTSTQQSNENLLSNSQNNVLLSDISSSEDEEWEKDTIKNVKPKSVEKSTFVLPTPSTSKTDNNVDNSHDVPRIKKQLSDLEEKRLRMKEKLQNDLMPNKKSIKVSKKENTQTKISTKKIENDTIKEQDMDLLKALNLSAKKPENSSSDLQQKSKSVTKVLMIDDDNAVAGDCFEKCKSKISHLAANESQSQEIVEVHNAAMALTTLQKNTQKNLTNIKNLEENVSSNTTKKTLVSKLKQKCLEIEPVKRTVKESLKKVELPKTKDILAPTRSSQRLKNSPRKGLRSLIKAAQTRKEQINLMKNVKETTPTPSITVESEKVAIIDKIVSPSTLDLRESLEKSLDRCPSLELTDKSSDECDGIVNQIEATEIQSNYQINVNNDFDKVVNKTPIENDKNDGITNQQSNSEVVGSADREIDSESEDDDDSEEDLYDICEMTTIDEDDQKRFIKIISNSDKISNEIDSNQNIDKNLLKTEIKLMSEGKCHTLKISDEIELFTMEPKNTQNLETNTVNPIIKNIPKKREKNKHILKSMEPPITSSASFTKSSLSSSSSSSSSLSSSSSSSFISPKESLSSRTKATTVSNQQKDKQQSASDNIKKTKYDDLEIKEKPKHTSTPCKAQFNVQYSNFHNVADAVAVQKKIAQKNEILSKKNSGERITRKISSPTKIETRKQTKADKKQTKDRNSQITSTTDEQSKILRQEDIYAVLSHLHGSDDTKL